MSASQQVSAESAIIAALNANNPFEKPPVVREQNIWGDSFPDIPSINAKASDTLFEAVAKVREADSSLDKVTSLVFLADRGTGKSHVIKRIRRRLQATSEGVFIYASVDRYGDLDLIDLLFQQSIAESLEQDNGGSVSQWQEIATLMVAEAIRASSSEAKVPTAESLVKNFDKLYMKRHQQGKNLVSQLLREIQRLKLDVDSYTLRALLWTLSEERGSLAVKWLAGEELTAQDAAELRLPLNHKSENEANASAPSTIMKLISLLSRYKTVIVCFDELDTATTTDSGLTAPHIILNLVKRVFDYVNHSAESKGVVLLTSILPHAWRIAKQNMQASMSRISAYCEPISLANLNEDNAKELCTLTLSKFYQKKGLVPPDPLYPFAEEEIATFSKNRPSARETLKWFAMKLNEIEPAKDKLSPKERFELAYKNALEQFEIEDLDANEVTASALRFCFQKMTEISSFQESPIESVVVKRVEDITPRSKNNGRLNFKIVGAENSEPVVIGIGVIQETHGRSVAAGFRRLLDTEAFGLSRGCLVRSRDRKIKRYWDSHEYYQQLIANGGEWVDLAVDDIKPLLALQYVYEQHERFNLTHKRLDSFAFTRDLLKNNSMIKEILSRPEGDIAEDALEGEEIHRLSEAGGLEGLNSDLALAEEELLVNESEAELDIQELCEPVSV